ncbi:MAG: hypothetical protein K2X82_14590, partial [Gemmataceae bacterium]|nr:hypothetical protein [Gemmataceae bacterium]
MPEPPPDGPLDTPALHGFVDRWRGGDRAAADDLIRGAGARLEKLARTMSRGFPSDHADVLNAALVRLLRTLRSVRPAGTRDFYRLAAVQLRRELLDLARYYRRRPSVPLDPGRRAADDPAR